MDRKPPERFRRRLIMKDGKFPYVDVIHASSISATTARSPRQPPASDPVRSTGTTSRWSASVICFLFSGLDATGRRSRSMSAPRRRSRYRATPRNTSSRSRSLGWLLGCRRCTRGATSPCSSSNRARWPVVAVRSPCRCCTAGNLLARRSPCQVWPSPTLSPITVPSDGAAPVWSSLRPTAAAAASTFLFCVSTLCILFRNLSSVSRHVVSENFYSLSRDARLGLGVGGRRFGSRGKYLVLHMQVDVFSFGIVLWKILTGEEPYANMHCGAIIDHVSFNTTMNYVEENCAPTVYTPELRYVCIAGRYIQGAPLLGNSTAASDEILAVDTPSEGGCQ
ncbi:alpha/beta-Hydrolases superfamily protein [Zea mays]|uniref:Alpha/beta-Hydrolases superfamily protein n=1 Tax=Zea mays TaxID=4577 RepID=A0A1D6PE23_MAIZE|nr:alpha/beta-Hydrolases superfamily protein [Zea mays]